MTNGWIDIKNTDMMLIMGGNPAENHPCGFKWAIEAKVHRNAKTIVVDPRLTRTAANADMYLQIRAGADIAFLGGLINYAIAPSRDVTFAMAEPYLQRGRVDDATMRECTAFGPAEAVIAKIEEYVKGGGSKFILRPLCPSDRVLEQLATVAEQVVPEYHSR